MDLEKELDAAYALVTARYGAFVKPRLTVGDDAVAAALPESDRVKDIFAPLPNMLYEDAKNEVLLSEALLGPGEYDRRDRMYGLCHELGHALVCQQNPSLGMPAVNALLRTTGMREQGETAVIFGEGIADHIAIDACAHGDAGLQDASKRRAQQLDDRLRDWRASNEFGLLATIYGLKPQSWRAIAVRYLRRNPGAYAHFTYDFGRVFCEELAVGEVVPAIKDPPRDFRELFYPGAYRNGTRRVF